MKKLPARIKFYHKTHMLISSVVDGVMDRTPWYDTLASIRQLHEISHPLGPEW